MDGKDCCSNTIDVVEIDNSTPDAEDKVAETYTLTVQVLSNSKVNISVPKVGKKKSRKRFCGNFKKKRRKPKPEKPTCATCGRVVMPCPMERIQKRRRRFARVPSPQYQEYDYCSGKCAVEKQPQKKATPLELAVTLQQYIRPFYTLCHGLLAGLGLTHSILAGSVGNNVEMRWLLESYYLISLKIHGAYYFLAVICFISVLDRFDLAHMNFFHIPHLVRYRPLDVVIFLLYLIVFLSTNVAFRWDQRMATPIFRGVWWQNQQELLVEFVEWKTISLCRGISAILGWICVVICEGEDMLHLHLANIIKYQ